MRSLLIKQGYELPNPPMPEIFLGIDAIAIDNSCFFHYNTKVIGVWRSLVSRLVRVQEASGSNPDTPTIAEPAVDTIIDCRFVIFM